MVWEALRFVPIRPDIFRKPAGDYTIAKRTAHESVIPAGPIVRLLTHSAMFDPYAYEDPDRSNPNRLFDHNFNFGFGQHQCLTSAERRGGQGCASTRRYRCSPQTTQKRNN